MRKTAAKTIPVFERNHAPGKMPLAYVSQAATSIGASKAAGVRSVAWSLRYPSGLPAVPGCWIVKERE